VVANVLHHLNLSWDNSIGESFSIVRAILSKILIRWREVNSVGRYLGIEIRR
jgi:hypothetical protein